MKKILIILSLFLSAFCNATNVLTPHGYVDASTLHVGDQVVSCTNGIKSINTIETINYWTASYDTLNQGLFDFYLINGNYNLYKNQSIWANGNVKHVSELIVGDTIYDDSCRYFVINTITKNNNGLYWWRFNISGDHSYIADGISLHNASRFWVGGGSSANWSATVNTNWSATTGGANNASVPGSSDDVTFDGAQYVFTVTAANATIGATYTNNGHTFTVTGTISSGVTLVCSGNGAPSAGPGTLTKASGTGDATIAYASFTTTNGNTNSTISANITTLSFTNGTGYTSTITTNTSVTYSIAGNLTTATGINWVVNGTGLWKITATSTITSGGVTFVPPLSNGGTGITWTLSGNFVISGLFTAQNGFGTLTINHTTSETMTCSGGITISGPVMGNAALSLTGGTWSGTSTAQLELPTTISGNVTVSGNVNYGGATFTYSSGTVTTTGSTLNVTTTSTTLNTNGITWNAVTITGGITVTLSSNLTCTGLLTLGNTVNTTTINGSFTASTSGGLTLGATTGAVTGTSTVQVTAGTIASSHTTGYLGINTTIAGSVTWAAGTVNLSNNTLTFSSGTQTFNASLIIGIIGTGGAVTITNNINGLSTIPEVLSNVAFSTANIFNGSFGMTIGTFIVQITGSSTYTWSLSLLQTNTYNINTQMQCYLSGAGVGPQTRPLIKSSSAGNKVTLTLAAAATQNNERLNFTDVDASSGQTIFTYSPVDTPVTLSNTKNINTTPTNPITVGSGIN